MLIVHLINTFVLQWDGEKQQGEEQQGKEQYDL